MLELREKRVVVTGGSGFLGRAVVRLLITKGAIVTVPRSSRYDLRRRTAVQFLYATARPDVVIHLAAAVGGIGANQANPGKFLYDNAIMGIEMIDVAREFNLGKFVQVGTVCSYPKHCPTPFKEENIWNGYPEETNAPYGIAKKLLLTQCQAYREQYGLNAIYLIPVNLYGPHDNFDPSSSHVIPALIRKFMFASKHGLDKVEVWGDGTATREFLYVDDCADAIVSATESYDSSEPCNIGTGTELYIGELVDVIQKATKYKGSITWDRSKPNGQPRRRLDVSRALKGFGFQAKTSLEEGINKTVEWANANIDCN